MDLLAGSVEGELEGGWSSQRRLRSVSAILAGVRRLVTELVRRRREGAKARRRSKCNWLGKGQCRLERACYTLLRFISQLVLLQLPSFVRCFSRSLSRSFSSLSSLSTRSCCFSDPLSSTGTSRTPFLRSRYLERRSTADGRARAPPLSSPLASPALTTRRETC
jgi:hypothetical protein